MNNANSNSVVVQILAVIFSAVFSVLVIVNAISNFLGTVSPDFALTINPLNSAARINSIAHGINADRPEENYSRLREKTVNGILIEPADARFFSLLGTITALKVTQSGRLNLLILSPDVGRVTVKP